MTPDEREAIRSVALSNGLPPLAADRFCDRVEQRLEMGAEEYGEHRYLHRSFTECEAEAIEEQTDAGGWSVLGLRLLNRDVGNGFPSQEAELVRMHTLRGIALAHQSAMEFEAAVEHYEQFEEEIKPPPEPPYSCHDERVNF